MRGKEISDLPVNWKEIIEEKMSEGMCPAVVLKEFKISRNAHLRLMKNNEEYCDEFSHGLVLFEAWWTEHIRNNISEKNGGAYFMLKTVAGYREYDAQPREVKTPVPETGKDEKDFGKKYPELVKGETKTA